MNAIDPCVTVLQAVERHPGCTSVMLLGYLLSGETLGRMAEKGLTTSPFFGALAAWGTTASLKWVKACLDLGWLATSDGTYPGLCLTQEGRMRLASSGHAEHCRDFRPRDPRAHYLRKGLVNPLYSLPLRHRA